jgi:phage N-6-adenine-methyltransferase
MVSAVNSAVETLGLVKYDRMRSAIVEARKVDEVKDIRDKARALEVYTAQARDRLAERQVAEIRVRAERRCGELLKEMEKNGERHSEHGSRKSVSEAPTRTLDDLGITRDQSSQWQALADIPEAKFEAALRSTAEVFGKATTQGVIDAAGGRVPRITFVAEHLRGTFGTGENEWYTPSEYIEMAREVMGHFDLDPASSSLANKHVKARRFYTVENDGLTQDWWGKVWLNPPYAQPLIAQFIDRLVECVEAGDVTEAILLTHNYTDTSWFHRAAAPVQLICFTRGRIGFLDAQGNAAAPTQGQAFFYYGTNLNRFAEVFRQIGLVVRSYRDGF